MIGHLLNATLTVRRPTVTTDDVGGQTVAWTTEGTVRALVAQPSAADRQVAQQAGAELSCVVYVRADEDVRRGDELSGSDVPTPGMRLRVHAVLVPSRRAYKRLECNAVQEEGEA